MSHGAGQHGAEQDGPGPDGAAARPPLVVCEGLVRIHRSGSVEVQALQGLDLVVAEREVVAVVGASGSGKSTLLTILAGLDVPSAGTVRVGTSDLTSMTAAERLEHRRNVVGVVWQQADRNLFPYLSAAQNVDLPQALAGRGRRERRRRTAELLDLVGVGHCAGRRPGQLSGGERQRVAVCVALAGSPRLLLADEPTGELDAASSRDVFDAVHRANTELGTTALVVTHDPQVSERVSRTVAVRDGRTSSETLRRTESRADGQDVVVAEEFAVLDRAGRLQLPRDYREALALTRRVRLALESDRVAVRADRT